jgi:hypothetical protein
MTHYLPFMTQLIAALLVCSSACADSAFISLGDDDHDEAHGHDANADLTTQLDLDDSTDLSTQDQPPDLPLDSSPDLPEDIPDASSDLPDLPPDLDELTPTRYPDQALLSPMTPATAHRWRQIWQRRPQGPDPTVFMKVGASGTVSPRLLTCFDPASSLTFELDGRSQLLDTITHFTQTSLPGGRTSFGRVTLAAEVGRAARWAITGSPSPLQSELNAINPRFAVVNYGTNDMGGASTYEAALWPFWNNMSTLLDQLEERGVVTLITGLNPRSDRALAAQWVPVFDLVTRALAEQRQLPYLSLYYATKDLPNQGLISDGIHGNAYSLNGAVRPCHFTQEGLSFNYNIRNLLTLEVFERLYKTLVLDEPRYDLATAPLQGAGLADDPFLIDALPFTHSASTSGAARLIDRYPGCDQGQNEGGGELYYRLTLDAPTTLRAMIFDRSGSGGSGVDVDLHLLGADADPTTCLVRHDRTFERALSAGTYTLVVDSFVSGGVAREGDYVLVLMAR